MILDKITGGHKTHITTVLGGVRTIRRIDKSRTFRTQGVETLIKVAACQRNLGQTDLEIKRIVKQSDQVAIGKPDLGIGLAVTFSKLIANSAKVTSGAGAAAGLEEDAGGADF